MVQLEGVRGSSGSQDSEPRGPGFEIYLRRDVTVSKAHLLAIMVLPGKR